MCSDEEQVDVVVQLLCPTLCDLVDCSMPGFPVLHYLSECTQTHVHWVDDAIQPTHPLLSPSPALNLPQHQGLFQWVGSSHQVAKVLELHLQHQSPALCYSWFYVRDCEQFPRSLQARFGITCDGNKPNMDLTCERGSRRRGSPSIQGMDSPGQRHRFWEGLGGQHFIYIWFLVHFLGM